MPKDDRSELLEDASEAVAEIGDSALESVLADGPLEDAPVLGTLLKFWRGYRSLRDVLFERKLRRFLLETAKIPREEKEAFRSRAQSDPGLRREIGEHLVAVLERLDDSEKVPIVANIFAAFIRGRISLDELRRFMQILDRAMLGDLVALRETLRSARPLARSAFDALESIGLVAIQHSIVRSPDPEEHQTRVDLAGTSLLIRISRIASAFVAAAFPKDLGDA